MIFSDISSSSSVGFFVDGNAAGGPESGAAAFTPAANSTMNEARVKVFFTGFGFLNFNLYLYSDSSGVPGSSQETLGTDLSASLLPGGVVSDSSFAPLALTGGTQYWLAMTPLNPGSSVKWNTGGDPTSVCNSRLAADDFVALAKQMGSETVEFIESRWEGKFQLEINREKTRVVDPREQGASLNFPGYTFRYDRARKAARNDQ